MSMCPVNSAIDHGCTLLVSVGCWIYDFQTLIAGVLAIAAAIYAATPVWRELKETNLQTRIQRRETLASLLRESLERYARVAKDIERPLSDLDRLTSDPDGEPIEIDENDAHGMEQRLNGALNWYLVTLKSTETEQIEVAKEKLATALASLTGTLNDVYWTSHNDQHDEGHAIPDDVWAELVKRSGEAPLLAAEKVGQARNAFRALEAAQSAWIDMLRGQIAKLDLSIAEL